MTPYKIGSAILLVMLAGCSQKHSTIDRQQADAIATNFYSEFIRDSPLAASELAEAAAVEEQAGGWHYWWSCRNGARSGLGVFVETGGQADYDEAPVCRR